MAFDIERWLQDRWIRSLRNAGILPSVYGGELRLLRLSEGSTRPHDQDEERARSSRVPPPIPTRDSGGRNDLLVLEGDFRRNDLPRPRAWRLNVNRHTHTLDWRQASAWLLGDERPDDAWFMPASDGSGLFAQLVAARIEAFYERIETASALSRHGHAVLQALAKQIDPATRAMLDHAFAQARKDELVTRDRRIGFVDAISLLQGYSQTVRTVPTSPPLRAYAWSKEGYRPVARGHEGVAGEEPVVKVYGRAFKGSTARALIATFAQRLAAADEITAPHRPIARSGS